MKKVLAILLCSILVLSLAGVGSAVDIPLNEQTKSGAVTVQYTVVENYLITIPDTITITSGSSSTTPYAECSVGLSTVEDHILAPSSYLNLYVKSSNTWNLTNTTGDDTFNLSYKMQVNAAGYSQVTGSQFSQGATVYSLTPTTPGVDDDAKNRGTLIYCAPSDAPRTNTVLTFTLINSATHTGYYKDTLTFTVDLETEGDTLVALDKVYEAFGFGTATTTE